MNDTIEGSFQEFLKTKFNVNRKLRDMDLRIMRHFYFGGYDAALEMYDGATDLPNVIGVAFIQGRKRERDEYNVEIRRQKAKRKPGA